jgi:hypothetical protein
VKQDQEVPNNDHKSQGVAFAAPPSRQESENRKGEDKKKKKSGKLARAAGGQAK